MDHLDLGPDFTTDPVTLPVSPVPGHSLIDHKLQRAVRPESLVFCPRERVGVGLDQVAGMGYDQTDVQFSKGVRVYFHIRMCRWEIAPLGMAPAPQARALPLQALQGECPPGSVPLCLFLCSTRGQYPKASGDLT